MESSPVYGLLVGRLIASEESGVGDCCVRVGDGFGRETRRVCGEIAHAIARAQTVSSSGSTREETSGRRMIFIYFGLTESLIKLRKRIRPLQGDCHLDQSFLT